jgi:ABC-2 type transport system permease protein
MPALRNYWLLIEWQTLRLQPFILLAIVVQVAFAFGIVAGYPLLFPEIDELTVLFLATGAPAITLITMGLVALPQVVAQSRIEGSLDYMRSLPVPRMVFLMADLTVMLAIVLPGVVFAVAVGSWALDLALTISWTIIPAVLLVATTAGAIGYAMASVLPPMVAMLLTQVLVIGVLVFSPINFPAERLPEWMQRVHDVLPVEAMGEVIRGSLAADSFTLTAGPFAVLTGWCAIALGLSYLTLRRRA